MARFSLILGGARSGKTGFALKRGDKLGGTKVYIATAEGLDEEMQYRIQKHQIERPKDWQTIEEPLNISDALLSLDVKADVIVIDCLTLWLSNLLLKMKGDEKRIVDQMNRLVETITRIKPSILAISNEVGLGIVPENRISRLFRDYLGDLHQQLAEIALDVTLMVAGIPMIIKGDRNGNA